MIRIGSGSNICYVNTHSKQWSTQTCGETAVGCHKVELERLRDGVQHDTVAASARDKKTVAAIGSFTAVSRGLH